MLLRLVSKAHGSLALPGRMRAIVDAVAPLLPARGRVLDVGSGSGRIARWIMERNPLLQVEGIDVLVRPETDVPVRVFDGYHIPSPDGTFDAVMAIDVLHHVEDQPRLFREMARVSRGSIIIKDHRCQGRLDNALLSLMDWVGNRGHGVVLPYKYLSEEQWTMLFALSGRENVEAWDVPNMYPYPFSLALGGHRQVVYRLS